MKNTPVQYLIGCIGACSLMAVIGACGGSTGGTSGSGSADGSTPVADVKSLSSIPQIDISNLSLSESSSGTGKGLLEEKRKESDYNSVFSLLGCEVIFPRFCGQVDHAARHRCSYATGL